MKKILLAVLLFTVSASAGMIEYADDDPIQYLCFDIDSGLCDTNTVDSIQTLVQINPDSGWASHTTFLGDTLSSFSFRYIITDLDSLDRKIPGHYFGEYWLTTVTFFNNQPRLSADTFHVSVDYWVFGGCLPFFKED